MKRNDIVILILGIIIALFVGLTIMMTICYGNKKRNHLAKIGEIDSELIKEYKSEHSKLPLKIAGKSFEALLTLAFLTIFAFSIYSRINNNTFIFGNETLTVCKSASMSYKNKENTYLFDEKLRKEYNLDNQFNTYDMVFIGKKPETEWDIKLYDVVVYKKEDYHIIHRIIKIDIFKDIEGDHRLFTTKGDANSGVDAGQIDFSLIEGIYTSRKIPFVGLFILAIQSALGYVLIVVLLASEIFNIYISKSLNEASIKRLVEINYLIEYKNKRNKTKYKVNPDYVELADDKNKEPTKEIVNEVKEDKEENKEKEVAINIIEQPKNTNIDPEIIIQFDKKGRFINSYSSIDEIMDKNPSFNRLNVELCLKGRKYLANGYVFKKLKYVRYFNKKKKKPIKYHFAQYDQNNLLIRKYVSIEEILKVNKTLNEENIKLCLKGDFKTTGGYTFKRIDNNKKKKTNNNNQTEIKKEGDNNDDIKK